MADAQPIVAFKKRGAKAKGNIRKRPATPPSQSDSDSDYSSSENESGQRIKRRKKSAVVAAASSSAAANKLSVNELSATVYAADRSTRITSTNDATKHSNWFDEESTDAPSAKSLLGSTRALPKDATVPDGTYRGLANQTSFIQKNPDAPTRSVGPIKAPTNIRTVTQTDYAPDVCKDYKQT